MKLHDYQKRDVEFIVKHLRVAMLRSMGAGKSVTSLTAASELLDLFMVNRVLVIAPLRVSQNVWKQEAAKWPHLQYLDVEIASGLNAGARKTVLMNNADIHVINKEQVPWMIQNLPFWRWDMVIIDESSAFKSHQSKRFKALKTIIHKVKSVLILTGTPSPNGLMDLWSQFYLLDAGERLGRNITMYRNRWFTPGYMNWTWSLRDGAEQEIYDRIADICLKMNPEDYVELPDRVDLYEEVILPVGVMKQYRELEKEFLLDIDEVTFIEISTEANLSNKLLQLVNGAVYDEDRNWHEIHNEKVDRLKEIIEDNPDENFLVSYLYKSDLARIQKALPEAQILSDKNIAKWNRGEIKILLAHPASAAHGLNLQFGGSVIIWFGITWNLEHYQQFNARLHRQGQTRPVRIIYIIAKGTVDERVVRAIDGKAKTQKELLDYLQR